MDTGADVSISPPTDRIAHPANYLYAANSTLTKIATVTVVIADVTKPIIGATFLYEYEYAALSEW